MIELSEKVKGIIRVLFGLESTEEIESVLLQNCSNNLPGCEDWPSKSLERVWLSVLKLSDGNMQKLESAIELANTDCRDLFMAAGFGYDLEAHLLWQP